MKYSRFKFLSVAIGSCDALTGLLLMCAPLMTLRLMQISNLPSEPVYLRFIGGFVFAIGSSYFLPFFERTPGQQMQTLRSVWILTAWCRLVIAMFISMALINGALSLPWITVAITDASFACLQVFALSRGIQPDMKANA